MIGKTEDFVSGLDRRKYVFLIASERMSASVCMCVVVIILFHPYISYTFAIHRASVFI